MTNETSISVSTIVGRFDERSENEIQGITSFLYCNGIPDEVLRALYERVDTCDFNELSVISAVLNNTSDRTASFISGYLAAFDLTVKILGVKSQGRKSTVRGIYFGALGSIQRSFEAVGLDKLPHSAALSTAHADLLCAEILASSVNVFRDDYDVLHDFHTDLEAIRKSIATIRELLPEFIEIRKDGTFIPSIPEAIEVLEYIAAKGSKNSKTVLEACRVRGGFDREVLDLILSNPSRAVSEGVL